MQTVSESSQFVPAYHEPVQWPAHVAERSLQQLGLRVNTSVIDVVIGAAQFGLRPFDYEYFVQCLGIKHLPMFRGVRLIPVIDLSEKQRVYLLEKAPGSAKPGFRATDISTSALWNKDYLWLFRC